MSAVPVARLALAAFVIAVLGGCVATPPASSLLQAAAGNLPQRWQAPLPQGAELASLSEWWSQFNDPLLDQLVREAQAVSPSVSTARLHIEQARTARVAADGGRLPTLDASAGAQRGVFDSRGVVASGANSSITASWELDLFGANAAERDEARASFEGAQALWHDARISVAAEVASQYTALRACEAAVVQRQIDADSRSETARLTALTAHAGFESPANESLALAAAAQSRSLLRQQGAQCDAAIKALVALTAHPEPALREALAASRGVIAEPRAIAVPAVPAALLTQRPDLANAERAVMSAAASITQEQAERLPRIRLSGSVGTTYYKGGGFGGFGSGRVPSIDGSGSTWAIGPVSVSMPLFDAGVRAAKVDAARARLADATVQYSAALRRAVEDVERALVSLQASAERQPDAELAAARYADSLRATEARQRGGLGSLFELEDMRRFSVQAQLALIDLRRERVTAWISLYRALGGGWSAESLAQSDAGDSPASGRTGAAP